MSLRTRQLADKVAEERMAAHLVELARLAGHPAWPLRKRERAHRLHHKGVAVLNGTGKQRDDVIGDATASAGH